MLANENKCSVPLLSSPIETNLRLAAFYWSTHLAQLKMLRLESLLDHIVLFGSTRLSSCGGGGGSRCQAVKHLSYVKLLHFPPIKTRR